MDTVAERLTGYLTNRLSAYVEELRQLCAIECPTDDKPGVDSAGAWVTRWAEARGWPVQVYPETAAGNNLAVTLNGAAADGAVILLAAHLDTVYPVGIAARRPMRREGDRLIGPGTADNKSGLLSALYAMAALQDLELLEPMGRMLLVAGSDEETSMETSGELLTDLAAQADVGLVLEAARENGDIVGARKGSGHFVLEVTGREAHAGVEPHKGANAILALAQQIAALQALNGMRPGTTVNVGIIQGGSVSNVVPGRAKAVIDVRVAQPEDMAPVEAALREIGTTPHVPGTSAQVSGGWNKPPMAMTPAIAALAELAVECAAELGFETAAASTGGISYANLLAQLDLPALDGLGPVGGLDHSPDEYILESSIVPRTALLALLMLRYAQSRL